MISTIVCCSRQTTLSKLCREWIISPTTIWRRTLTKDIKPSTCFRYHNDSDFTSMYYVFSIKKLFNTTSYLVIISMQIGQSDQEWIQADSGSESTGIQPLENREWDAVNWSSPVILPLETSNPDHFLTLEKSNPDDTLIWQSNCWPCKITASAWNFISGR